MQVVADQIRLWQAQSRRLQTHAAQLYARFETKQVRILSQSCQRACMPGLLAPKAAHFLFCSMCTLATVCMALSPGRHADVEEVCGEGARAGELDVGG